MGFQILSRGLGNSIIGEENVNYGGLNDGFVVIIKFSIDAKEAKIRNKATEKIISHSLILNNRLKL